MTLESLARTIALARHGTDAMWANYLPSAEAVVMALMAAAETAKPDNDSLFVCFANDADGIEDNVYLDADEARMAFRAMMRTLLAQPDGAPKGNPARKFGLGVKR